jgi:hypothetical protein
MGFGMFLGETYAILAFFLFFLAFLQFSIAKWKPMVYNVSVNLCAAVSRSEIVKEITAL